MLYQEYITSSVWREKRKRRITLDGGKCRLCDHDGSKFRLEVHHRPNCYKLIPHESVENDLITVCARCHALVTNSIRKDRAAGKQTVKRFRFDRRMWEITALILTIAIPFLIYVSR